MATDNLQHNDMVVDALRKAIRAGDAGLKDVPGLVVKVVTEKCWQARHVHQTRKKAEFDDFIKFIEAYPPEGLGTDIKTLRRLCSNNDEATQILALVAEPLAEHGEVGRGRENRPYNIRSKSEFGTNAEYLTARIARDYPEIHERMKAGEYTSVRRAAIDAGIIRELTNVEKIQKLWLKMTPEEKEEFQIWATEQLCG